MDHIALLILGIFISVIGIVNMTGNISTIHSYNRRRVKEEDIKQFQSESGYNDVFIPAMQRLSPAYREYHKSLQAANEVFLRHFQQE